MEQEMKISTDAVRRLRAKHGWSQDQLAVASGLSLRTIQRLEAVGTASMGTKVSLAATFGVELTELSEKISEATGGINHQAKHICSLMIGLAVMACGFIAESGRLPGLPTADGLAVVIALLGALGAILAIASAFRLISYGQVVGVGLLVLGTPLVTLLIGGIFVAVSSNYSPTWQVAVFGIGGAAFVYMALRQFKQPQQCAKVA
jgi:transcriptional regulator with XRE-family HTH domain